MLKVALVVKIGLFAFEVAGMIQYGGEGLVGFCFSVGCLGVLGLFLKDSNALKYLNMLWRCAFIG